MGLTRIVREHAAKHKVRGGKLCNTKARIAQIRTLKMREVALKTHVYSRNTVTYNPKFKGC